MRPAEMSRRRCRRARSRRPAAFDPDVGQHGDVGGRRVELEPVFDVDVVRPIGSLRELAQRAVEAKTASAPSGAATFIVPSTRLFDGSPRLTQIAGSSGSAPGAYGRQSRCDAATVVGARRAVRGLICTAASSRVHRDRDSGDAGQDSSNQNSTLGHSSSSSDSALPGARGRARPGSSAAANRSG